LTTFHHSTSRTWQPAVIHFLSRLARIGASKETVSLVEEYRRRDEKIGWASLKKASGDRMKETSDVAP
jgi:hypothetical protein